MGSAVQGSEGGGYQRPHTHVQNKESEQLRLKKVKELL